MKSRRYITLFSLLHMLAIIHNLKLIKSNNQIKPALLFLSSSFPKSSRNCFLMLLSFAVHSGVGVGGETQSTLCTGEKRRRLHFPTPFLSGHRQSGLKLCMVSTERGASRICFSSLASKETHLLSANNAFSASE